MDEVNGKMRNKHEDVDAASLDADILNPFVHRLELDTTYDKLKVSSFPNLFRTRKSLTGSMCTRTQMFLGIAEGRAGRGACEIVATTLTSVTFRPPRYTPGG